MKNDAFKGSEIRLPEESPVDVPELGYQFGLWSIFRWLVRRFFPKKAASKKMLKVKHKTRKPDGSGTETEITYHEER